MPTSRVHPRRAAALLRSGSSRPGRLRLLAVVAVVAVLGTFTAGTLAVRSASNGLQVVGHGAGPQVVATADLYFALSDMDTQVASVLLMGNQENLGVGREQALDRYEQRRAQASQAILEATDLAGDDEISRDTIRSMLDSLGQYERLAAEAMLLSKQADHAPGQTPQRVVDLYRQASELMKRELLPKAYNLTLDSGSIVRQTFESTQGQVGMLRLSYGIAGVSLVVMLVGIQVYLAVRFRRTVNPALLVATVATLAVVLSSVLVLTSATDSLRTAKEDGFDATLSVSRARSISNSMQADESRFLLDSPRQDTYESSYLDKSQTVFYKEAANLAIYRNAVELSVEAYREGQLDEGALAFLGLFGDEAERAPVGSEKAALVKALEGYEAFQESDAEMRAREAAGRHASAIRYRMGSAVEVFNEYDRAMVDLIGLHQKAFNGAIRAGEDSLRGWRAILPGAAVVIALLILIGIRARVVEYR